VIGLDTTALPSRAPACAVFGAIAGIAVYFFVLDPRLLDPSYWIWLMEGDPAAEYLGWRFFRAEPWQWPPGAFRHYGLEIGSAIPYTDAIPIAAFAGKLASSWLPEPFQYFGLWALMCFALQGWFGGLVASLASDHAIDRYAITLLFVASVPLLDRAIGHYALMSHWIVLWGLWLALQPRRELATGPWTAIVCIAALVHAYLLYLALALWVADVLRRRHFDPPPRPTFQDWLRHVIVVVVALGITMALAGYFVLPGEAISGGSMYYGKFAANLNALFNPGWGSPFLPALPVIEGSAMEGYAYLGAGVLAMCAFALVGFLKPGGASPKRLALRPADPRDGRARPARALAPGRVGRPRRARDSAARQAARLGRDAARVGAAHVGRDVRPDLRGRRDRRRALRAAHGDDDHRRMRGVAARRSLAAIRRDARLLPRPLRGRARGAPVAAEVPVLDRGGEVVQDPAHRARAEHGARLGVARALRGRPRHGHQHRAVRAHFVPAHREGERERSRKSSPPATSTPTRSTSCGRRTRGSTTCSAPTTASASSTATS
jgi:hypothetical protein